MHYNPDGTIQEVPYWQETKLEQIENFNPYRRVEAETMTWGYGLKAENHKNGGLYITCLLYTSVAFRFQLDGEVTLIINGEQVAQKIYVKNPTNLYTLQAVSYTHLLTVCSLAS